MSVGVGTGTTIAFATSGWTGKITRVRRPRRSRKDIDTSHMGTVNSHTSIPAQLAENGSVSFDYQYDPVASAIVPMNGVTETVTITLPGGKTIVFQGYWIEDSGEVPLEALMTGSATVKVTGDLSGTAMTVPASTPAPTS